MSDEQIDMCLKQGISVHQLRLNNIILDLLESYRDGALHTWGKGKVTDRDLPVINSEIEKLRALEYRYWGDND